MTSCNLRAVRALIESGWHAGSTARNSDGVDVFPNSPAAVSWCLLGAIGRVRGIDCEPRYDGYISSPEHAALARALTRVEPSQNYWSPMTYNDRQFSSAPVLALIDMAIADAEAVEQEFNVEVEVAQAQPDYCNH